ncbi:hypothetical protein PENTCL1PPCAC_16738 [Pristionchus entomophagus]|uniref:7TM GPCR serpentine receptor class x (Srx) domain-containing protein n=1 Tax=Pristionchus entomophagus TaxID=358040 RepID=A0AAV5TJV2_9BILA|nr:hypothetical protein PENTCL1PPCAC_16738 [Pristionchus entomophagus]
MDSGQFEQATILVHLASFFGFTTNVMAFLTIRYNAHLHTSFKLFIFRFGFICACLAANNSFVLVLNSSWFIHKPTGWNGTDMSLPYRVL